MRLPAALVIGLMAVLSPVAADEAKVKVAVVMPYHGSYDPHWVYKAHELPEYVQKYLSVTYDVYDIKVYPGEFETFGVTKVQLQGGKTYVVHQETVNTGEELMRTEFGYALKQAASFTNNGKNGLIIVLPAFVDGGGEHQGQEIPEVINIILGKEVPQYAIHYEPFGITDWDRKNDIGVVPELIFENIQAEANKTLVGPNEKGAPTDVFAQYNGKKLLDFLKDHKNEVGLLQIMFGTLRIGFWDNYKANAMYVLRGVAERLGKLLGVQIPVGEVDWALKNPFVKEGKAYFFAFQNPEIGPENWAKSRWEIRYSQFKQLMQDFDKNGVRYIIAFPYSTVTGITDRKLFEGNPEHGPQGDEPDAYNYSEAILRHFGAQLVAETTAEVEHYTYVKNGQTKTRTVYINTRIYKIPKDKLGTQHDMYIIYVRRGLLDAPKAVEKVARVYVDYISMNLPTWMMAYEASKRLAQQVAHAEQVAQQALKTAQHAAQVAQQAASTMTSQTPTGHVRTGHARKRAPVFPVVLGLALLIPALRRR